MTRLPSVNAKASFDPKDVQQSQSPEYKEFQALQQRLKQAFTDAAARYIFEVEGFDIVSAYKGWNRSTAHIDPEDDGDVVIKLFSVDQGVPDVLTRMWRIPKTTLTKKYTPSPTCTCDCQSGENEFSTDFNKVLNIFTNGKPVTPASEGEELLSRSLSGLDVHPSRRIEATRLLVSALDPQRAVVLTNLGLPLAVLNDLRPVRCLL